MTAGLGSKQGMGPSQWHNRTDRGQITEALPHNPYRHDMTLIYIEELTMIHTQGFL